MSRKTGWKRILIVTGVATVSMVALLLTVGAVGFVWATATANRIGEATPEPISRTIAVADRSADGRDRVVGADGATRLDIELEEGTFEIRPGAAGTDVTVEGAYAKGYYELIEERTPASDRDGPRTLIQLRPSHGFLVRLVGGAMNGASELNDLTVTIPRDLPIALTLRLRAGESRIDLGGLNLTELEADLSMGSHRLDFSEPLANELRQVRLDGRMGEVRLEHLGNAQALEFEATSRMGSFSADLGGEWDRETVPELSFRMLMGELRLDIPSSVRVAADSQSLALLGESSQFHRGDESIDPASPTVRLNVSTTMGETRVSRY